MSVILVTGGTGAIGSAIAAEFAKTDDVVITYNSRADEVERLCRELRCQAVQADVADYESARRAVEQVVHDYGRLDLLVNNAGIAQIKLFTDITPEDWNRIISVNLTGVFNMTQAAVKPMISRKSGAIVNISSVWGVYGGACESAYSASKAGADLLVQSYYRTYGLPVSISRCSNNYGPYHFPEKLIPLMIANALVDKPLPVYGEGLNVRDWLYVEDHCKAIDLIIHKGRVGEVYNVGGHNEKQNIEIVKIICKELGKPESLITHVGDRKGHDMRYAIDPTKIHNELGWLPETKFEDGIKKTIQWYLDNREWWETIISGEYQHYYAKMYGNR